MTQALPAGLWQTRIARTPGPLYRAIADAIAAAVAAGELLEGERLPPHRALAATLGVDLTTVTRAYAEARSRGLLAATIGRGTFIQSGAGAAPRAERHAVVDLTMILPPVPADPALRSLLTEGLARLLRQQDVATVMAYRLGAGTAEDHAAGALWLRPTLGRIDPHLLLLCPGAQSAMLAVLSTLAAPGDTVLTEQWAYPGLRALAAQLRLLLAGVACDGEGMRPDALDRACIETSPRAIYCNPTIHNPTTATMPEARRREIVAVARRHGVPILEDDTYGLLPAAPLPALAALAPDIVFHVATTAKTLSPGLRTAYLLAPGRAQAARLTTALRATVLMGSGLLTGLTTQWIRGGQAAALRDAIRAEAVARQSLARDILAGAEVAAHPEGLHLWLTLPAHWTAAEFAAYVRRQGLALVPGAAFAVQGGMAEAVRIALGAAADRAVLRQSLAAVAAALKRHAPAGFEEIV